MIKDVLVDCLDWVVKVVCLKIGVGQDSNQNVLGMEDSQLKIWGACSVFIPRHQIKQLLLAPYDLKVHVLVQIVRPRSFENMLTKIWADEVTDVPSIEAVWVIQMVKLILSAPVKRQVLLVELDVRSYLHADWAHLWYCDTVVGLHRLPRSYIDPSEAKLKAILASGHLQVLRHVGEDGVRDEVDVLEVQPAIEHDAGIRCHQNDRDERHNCADARPINFLAAEIELSFWPIDVNALECRP